MCSVGDDIFEGDRFMPTKEVTPSKTCNKCKTAEPELVLRGKDAYCKGCFLEGATHKFKSTLGKSKLIRPRDRVLILYEDNENSIALLHMVRNGLDLNTPKKLNFIPVIVFIEDQYHLTVKERHDMTEQIKEVITALNFDVFLVSLAQYATNIGSTDKLIYSGELPISESDKDELFKNLQTHTSDTNKTELMSIIKRNLLMEVAKHLDCKYIFTSEISMDITTNLLKNVSLGRGSQIPLESGFCDDRDNQVRVLRPLYLFDSKEIEYYNKYNNISYVHARNNEVNPYSSIHTLMKKFVMDLQNNFPSTVTTVLKTGDKIDRMNGEAICQLCKAPLCENSAQLTSEESTKFSSLISNSKLDFANLDFVDKPLDQTAERVFCLSCNELSKCLIKS
nr:unnamed protein product [Callosobruchus chinensis]